MVCRVVREKAFFVGYNTTVYAVNLETAQNLAMPRCVQHFTRIPAWITNSDAVKPIFTDFVYESIFAFSDFFSHGEADFAQCFLRPRAKSFLENLVDAFLNHVLPSDCIFCFLTYGNFLLQFCFGGGHTLQVGCHLVE